jgi:hypothetical protein
MQYSTHTSPPDRHTLAIQHDSIILVLEPLNGSGLAYFLVNANLAATVLAFSNSTTRPSEDNVKVHYLLNHVIKEYTSIDSNSRIILDIQVDVFLNTKSKVTSLTKISLFQFVLLDFKSTFKDFLSLIMSTPS